MKSLSLGSMVLITALLFLRPTPACAITNLDTIASGTSQTAADPLYSWPGMSFPRVAGYDGPAEQFAESVGLDSCSAGCPGCNRCSKPNRGSKSYKWISGVEATFLQPNLHGRDIQYQLQDPGGVPLGTVPQVDAEELIASPRVWLGLQGRQWGFLIRFWSLDSSELGFEPFGTTAGSTAFGRLDVYTIDLEATRKFRLRGHDLVGTIGVRYAEFDHQQFVSGFQMIGTELFQGTAMTDQHLGDVGPTFSLNGVRPLKGNWNVFWKARGSVLFGETRHAVQTSAAVNGPGVGVGTVNSATSADNETLFIGEFQLGLQRDYRLVRLPAHAFFRFGFEYQYWDADSAGGAFSTSFATLGANAMVNSSSATDVRMDLVGFAISTGFHW